MDAQAQAKAKAKPQAKASLAELKRKVELLPASPGVYLFRDARGEVIYVGKAASLRERVRSYFSGYHQQAQPKVGALLERLADLEYIATETEVEALVLEESLIKSYRPHFNVRLKDDKRFPYLAVTLQEPFPRLRLARRPAQDGARYFGPYTNLKLIREHLNELRRIFPLRTCNDPLDGRRPTRRRPCLDHSLKQCLAPCVGGVSQEEYRQVAQELCRFLEGRRADLLGALRREMEEAAAKLEFERAARLRDRLKALEGLVQLGLRSRSLGSVATAAEEAERDVIGLARTQGLCAVQVFFVREGRVKGRERFLLEVPADTPTEEALAAFLRGFYSEAEAIPREVLLPHPLEDEEARLLKRWLEERRGAGAKVKLHLPKRGSKARLVRLATHNAELTLLEEHLREEKRKAVAAILEELRQLLGLERLPRRIEGYDISVLQGAEAVGALVVFEDGLAKRSDYRRFKIEQVRGVDDYAMLREVLERRIAHLGELPKPDLILIDGGRGHLSAARRALEGAGGGWEGVPLAALAKHKQEERVYLEGRPEPLTLGEGGALHLLQRVRDEAHRFAVQYHRLRRKRRTLSSALDEVPGIGPKRKQLLLRHFGSLERLRAASLEELARVPGLPRSVATRVYEKLHEEG